MGTTLTPPASGVQIRVQSSGTGLGAVVTLTDVKDGTYHRTVQNSISDISLVFNNFQGKWTGSVVVGNELRLDIGRDNPPTTRIFTGLVTSVVNSQEQGTKRDLLEVQAQDYGMLLKNVTATEDFVNLEIGSIVKSLVAFYTPALTTTNVQNTGFTLARYLCKKNTVFDILQELAKMTNSQFYVDVNKDLHFEPIQLIQTTVASQPIITIQSRTFGTLSL